MNSLLVELTPQAQSLGEIFKKCTSHHAEDLGILKDNLKKLFESICTFEESIQQQLVYIILKDLNFSTIPNGALFWTGYDQKNHEIARHYALLKGKTTLEMTPGGELLDRLNLYDEMSPIAVKVDGKIQSPFADKLFDCASRLFAESAQGKVEAVVVDNISNTSTFARIERPILLTTPGVELTEHRAVRIVESFAESVQERDQLLASTEKQLEERDRVIKSLLEYEQKINSIQTILEKNPGELTVSLWKSLSNTLNAEECKEKIDEKKVNDYRRFVPLIEALLDALCNINGILNYLNLENPELFQTCYLDLLSKCDLADHTIKTMEETFRDSTLTESDMEMVGEVACGFRAYLEKLSEQLSKLSEKAKQASDPAQPNQENQNDTVHNLLTVSEKTEKQSFQSCLGPFNELIKVVDDVKHAESFYPIRKLLRSYLSSGKQDLIKRLKAARDGYLGLYSNDHIMTKLLGNIWFFRGEEFIDMDKTALETELIFQEKKDLLNLYLDGLELKSCYIVYYSFQIFEKNDDPNTLTANLTKELKAVLALMSNHLRMAVNESNRGRLEKLKESLLEGNRLKFYQNAYRMREEQHRWLWKTHQLLTNTSLGVLSSNPIIAKHRKVASYYDQAAEYYLKLLPSVAQAQEEAALNMIRGVKGVYELTKFSPALHQLVIKKVHKLNHCVGKIAESMSKTIVDMDYEKVAHSYEQEKILLKESLQQRIQQKQTIADKLENLADMWGNEKSSVAYYRERAILHKGDTKLCKLYESVAEAKEDEAKLVKRLITATEKQSFPQMVLFQQELATIGDHDGIVAYRTSAVTHYMKDEIPISECYQKIARLKVLELQELRKRERTPLNGDGRTLVLNTSDVTASKIMFYRRIITIALPAVKNYLCASEFEHLPDIATCYLTAATVRLRVVTEVLRNPSTDITKALELAESDGEIANALGDQFGAMYYWRKSLRCSPDSHHWRACNELRLCKLQQAQALDNKRNSLERSNDGFISVHISRMGQMPWKKKKDDNNSWSVGGTAVAVLVPVAVGMLTPAGAIFVGGALVGVGITDSEKEKSIENEKDIQFWGDVSKLYHTITQRIEDWEHERREDIQKLKRQLVDLFYELLKAIGMKQSMEIRMLANRTQVLEEAIKFYSCGYSFAAAAKIEEGMLIYLRYNIQKKFKFEGAAYLEKAIQAQGETGHSCVYYYHEAEVAEEEAIREKVDKTGLIHSYKQAAVLKRKEVQFYERIAIICTQENHDEELGKYLEVERSVVELVENGIKSFLSAAQSFTEENKETGNKLLQDGGVVEISLDYLLSTLPVKKDEVEVKVEN